MMVSLLIMDRVRFIKILSVFFIEISSPVYFKDIDECDSGASCPENSKCINTLGEYKCECDTGLDIWNIKKLHCLGNL